MSWSRSRPQSVTASHRIAEDERNAMQCNPAYKDHPELYKGENATKAITLRCITVQYNRQKDRKGGELREPRHRISRSLRLCCAPLCAAASCMESMDPACLPLRDGIGYVRFCVHLRLRCQRISIHESLMRRVSSRRFSLVASRRFQRN